MTITTGRRQAKPLDPQDSYLIICPQPDGWDYFDSESGTWSHDYAGGPSYVDDVRGAHNKPSKFQAQVDELGIVRQGSTIEANYLKANPIHSKQGPGPYTVGGPISFNISGNGTATLLRTVAQDRAPTANPKATWTSTDIVASTGLSSGASATVADDLDDILVPLPVTATLTETSALTAGQTGQIEVTGTNQYGTSETWTFEYTHPSPTGTTVPVAQRVQTSLLHFQEITTVDPNANFTAGNYEITCERPPTADIVASGTNLDSSSITLGGGAGTFGNTNPQQIYVKLSGTPQLDTGRIFGCVIFTGLDRFGNEYEDEVRFQDDELNDLKKTSLFFASITKVETMYFGSGTFHAQAVDTAQTVTITPSTELDVFVTLEAGKGNKPNTYRNCLFNSTSFNFERTSPVMGNAEVLGAYANLGRSLEDTNTPSSRDGLDYTSEDVFTGWQANIYIGNVELAARNATLTVNNNFQSAELLGSQYSDSEPDRAGDREILLNPELRPDEQNDFRDLFENNIELKNVRVELENIAAGSYPHKITFEFPSMQIVEDPDYAVSNTSVINQPLSLRGTWADLPYEWRMICEYSLYYPVPSYS